MDRCFSTLRIKSTQEDQRTFHGIASTPSTDRDGDVMEPAGAEFTLPLPLLWQHDMKAPIGHVTHATVTAKGIEVRAQIARVDEPGRLKDRLDEVWQSVKYGLVRGLSIGFKGVDAVPIKGGRGLHYKRWSWLELSTVTLPSNVQASILSVKAMDEAVRTGGKPRFALADLMQFAHSSRPSSADIEVLKGMTQEQLAEAIFKAAQGYVSRRLAPMEDRIKALESAQ